LNSKQSFALNSNLPRIKFFSGVQSEALSKFDLCKVNYFILMVSQKLIIRYNELKQELPNSILLMQVGAFMQVMNEDTRFLKKITIRILCR